MFSIEFFKYLLILITSVLGIFGTFYDFKDSGRVNRKGLIAVGALVILLVVSIVTEFLSNRESHRKDEIAAKQLRDENEQRRSLINKSENIEKRISASVNQLTILKQELSENHKAIKSAEVNLKELSEIQLARQKELNKDINNFKSIAEIELRRLSSPLEDLYFSTEFKFMNSVELFPNYYNLLIPEFYRGDGLYILSEKNIPIGFDIRKMYYFSPDRIKFSIYSGIEPHSLSFEILKNKNPELSFSSPNTERKLNFFEMYSNVDKDNIVRKVERMPLKLEASSGKFTSSLDITDFSKVGDYITFSFSSIYDSNVEISSLDIHTKKSRHVGIKLNNCDLINKQSGLTIHKSDSESVIYYNYLYACELWSSRKLEKGFAL